jgi:hypothetical protein
MLRYSLATLLGVVAAAAIVCAVLFAVPTGIRLVVLFVSVLAMPGPLFVAWRQGNKPLKAAAGSALVAYAAWFAVIGIPVGLSAASLYRDIYNITVLDLQTTIPSGGTTGMVVSGYLVFAGLYVPWLAVTAAGLGGLAMHALVERARSKSENKRDSEDFRGE